MFNPGRSRRVHRFADRYECDMTRSLCLEGEGQDWVELPRMPHGVAMAPSVVWDNELWVFGGSEYTERGSPTSTDRVWIFNLGRREWRELEQRLPAHRGGQGRPGQGGAALIAGDVYVLNPGNKTFVRYLKKQQVKWKRF